jgi:hypothetical protein
MIRLAIAMLALVLAPGAAYASRHNPPKTATDWALFLLCGFGLLLWRILGKDKNQDK